MVTLIRKILSPIQYFFLFIKENYSSIRIYFFWWNNIKLFKSKLYSFNNISFRDLHIKTKCIFKRRTFFLP